MAIDMAQVNRIHDLLIEIDQTIAAVKAVKAARTELITQLDEYKALEAAQQAVKDASAKLRQAILLNRELSVLEVERGEWAYKLHDLKEMLSHHLIAYKEDSARDIVRDSQGRNRHIELTATLSKVGKPVLDQPKLPLSQHFGVRQIIGEVPAPKQLTITENI